MSRQNTSDEKEALQLLENISRNSLLKPISDSTTHVLDTYPRRHHPSMGNAYKTPCAYRDLFKTMTRDIAAMHTTTTTHAILTAEKARLVKDWMIAGTNKVPWPPIQLESLIARLLNVVIDLVSTVLGGKRALTHAQQNLLTAETSDATNAAQSDGFNLVHVCQELLTQHPYAMND